MWIKVCGIRDRQTAQQVAELDVDAIGLNFYSRSPRVVNISEAVEISKLLPSKVTRVGVFVNQSLSEVESIARQCHLDIVQLHGDESLSYFLELQQRWSDGRLIRAWRMPKEGLDGLDLFLTKSSQLNLALAGCLVDAHVAGVFGGSGTAVDWDQLGQQYKREIWPSLILAGGLTPANVAAAVASVKPWGVDVASGVESSPGVKDLGLVKQFVLNARMATN